MPRRKGFDSRINIWDGMLQRCNNPDYPQWKDYGGRGVALKWESRQEFFDHVGDRPAGMTIDRIDNDGDYTPGNVRWATRAEQQYNKRHKAFVEIDGEKHRLFDLAQQSGLSRNTIEARVRRGLSMAEVLSPERQRDLSGLALGGVVSGIKQQQKTQCSNGHEFTLENTRITPQGWRNCRVCHRLKMRSRNLKKQ